MTTPAVKFLTGAPIATALDWSDEGLLNTFSSALQRHLDYTDSAPPHTPVPTQPVAKWRSIPLASNKTFHESPVLPQTRPHTNKSALPRGITSLQEDHDDFLDHSFAFEANLQSSQIASHHHSPEDGPEDGPEEATFMTDDSIYSTVLDDYDTTAMSIDQSIEDNSGPLSGATYRPVGPIMSIKAVPTAEYLQRIQPQTMTINLLVGIISVAPPRTVTTRKEGHEMDIIELTVGDETKAGFTISSWHQAQDCQQRQKNEDNSRTVLSSLRPQDVVLIERVALSSFRNAVFGQSLNRRATKNTTAFTVLHKAHDFRADSAQKSTFPLAVEHKLERVRDWVSSFVGPSAKRKARSEPLPRAGFQKKGKSAVVEEFLPADSQP